MDFTEITVFTNSENAELVAYFLQEVCMDGVSIFDKNDLYANASWDYKDESAEQVYSDEVMVKGYCELENTNSVLTFLRQKLEFLQDAGSLEISCKTVDGNAWVEKWKETFRPIETQKLVICPEWQSVTTSKVVFLMDAGVAFGTGQHETTSMCLKILEQLPLQGKTVLDVGCGSGILGICSLLLGAQNAELVDIDSQATDIAKHNAQINNIERKCVIKTGNLTEQTTDKFDIVFANLTADILQMLYQDISSVVKTGTILVLSGILDVKLDGIVQLYGKKFDIAEQLAQGEWRALKLIAR